MFESMRDFKSLDELIESIQNLIIQNWGWAGVAVITLCYLWWNWKEIKEKPFIESFITYLKLINKKPPLPVKGYFNIAITRLNNDHDDDVRTNLIIELQRFANEFNELGTKRNRYVNIVPVSYSVDLYSEADGASVECAHKMACKFLKKYGYDVLIWGAVREKRAASPTLFWTTLAHQDAYQNYHLSNKDEKLPELAARDLIIVLRALIVARSQTFQELEGHYVADILHPFIEALRRLIQTSKKRGWSNKALEDTKYVLADMLQTLGEQTGRNEPLDESIRLYKAILKSATSSLDKLYSARIGNKLGVAHWTLGKREL